MNTHIAEMWYCANSKSKRHASEDEGDDEDGYVPSGYGPFYSSWQEPLGVWGALSTPLPPPPIDVESNQIHPED
jgi:hypothetical protein